MEGSGSWPTRVFVDVYQCHLSVWRSSTELSIKTCRGKRWWKDLARWGANTSVRPVKGSTSHMKQNYGALFGFHSRWRSSHLPHTLHSTGSSVYLAWHCGQKYPPRDRSGLLLLSKWLGDTQQQRQMLETVGCETEWRLTSFCTHAMLNDGLASWSVREAMVCWGKPKHTHNPGWVWFHSWVLFQTWRWLCPPTYYII